MPDLQHRTHVREFGYFTPMQVREADPESNDYMILQFESDCEASL